MRACRDAGTVKRRKAVGGRELAGGARDQVSIV